MKAITQTEVDNATSILFKKLGATVNIIGDFSNMKSRAAARKECAATQRTRYLIFLSNIQKELEICASIADQLKRRVSQGNIVK